MDCGPCDSVEEDRMKRSRFSEEQVSRVLREAKPVYRSRICAAS